MCRLLGANVSGMRGISHTRFRVRSTLITYAMRKRNGVRSSGGTRRKRKPVSQRNPSDGRWRGRGPGWMALREIVFKRDGYVCQMNADGCTGGADICDHVTPIEFWMDEHDDYEGVDDPENLMSLCQVCSDRKTAEQRHESARRKRELKKELARKNHPGRKDRHL